MANENLIKVTGLWKSEDKNGNLVLSGNLSQSARLVIFSNNFKEQDGENAPDFVLYIDKREPKPQQ